MVAALPWLAAELVSGMSKLFASLLTMLAIAGATLLRRKVLGLAESRTRVWKTGMLQPLLDGLKLRAKQFLLPWKSQPS